MTISRTLDEAKSLVASLTTENEALKATLATLEAAGVVQSTVGDKLVLSIPRIAKLEAANALLAAELSAATDKLAAKTAVFNGTVEANNVHVAALEAKVAELEAQQKTVSATARELLASQGGKPLAIVDAGDLSRLSRDELIEASKNPALTPAQLFSIYQQIKAVKK